MFGWKKPAGNLHCRRHSNTRHTTHTHIDCEQPSSSLVGWQQHTHALSRGEAVLLLLLRLLLLQPNTTACSTRRNSRCIPEAQLTPAARIP